MSEPTRPCEGNRRVPLTLRATLPMRNPVTDALREVEADSGRSGRLKPYWGKPVVRNFREVAGNRARGRTEAPPTERGGLTERQFPYTTAPASYSVLLSL